MSRKVIQTFLTLRMDLFLTESEIMKNYESLVLKDKD